MSEILTVRGAQRSYRLERAEKDYQEIVSTILQISGTSYLTEVSVVFNGDKAGSWDEGGSVFAGIVLTPDSLMKRIQHDPVFTGCDIENTLGNGVQYVNIDFNLEKGDE